MNAVITDYEKKFDADQVTEQLVVIYDQHYSSEEIKELLQFYGSPLGQRVAAESTKDFAGNSGRYARYRRQGCEGRAAGNQRRESWSRAERPLDQCAGREIPTTTRHARPHAGRSAAGSTVVCKLRRKIQGFVSQAALRLCLYGRRFLILTSIPKVPF